MTWFSRMETRVASLNVPFASLWIVNIKLRQMGRALTIAEVAYATPLYLLNMLAPHQWKLWYW